MFQTFGLRESYRRVVGSRHFWECFAEHFLGHDETVRRHFDDVPPTYRRELLQRSLAILIDHAAGCSATGDDLDGLLRPDNRGRQVIPKPLYGQWLIALLKAVGECDPRFSDDLEITWRHTMERSVADLLMRDHELAAVSAGAIPPRMPEALAVGARPILNARLD